MQYKIQHREGDHGMRWRDARDCRTYVTAEAAWDVIDSYDQDGIRDSVNNRIVPAGYRNSEAAAYGGDERFIVTAHRHDESGERIFRHFRAPESYDEWASANHGGGHSVMQDDFGHCNPKPYA